MNSVGRQIHFCPNCGLRLFGEISQEPAYQSLMCSVECMKIWNMKQYSCGGDELDDTEQGCYRRLVRSLKNVPIRILRASYNDKSKDRDVLLSMIARGEFSISHDNIVSEGSPEWQTKKN